MPSEKTHRYRRTTLLFIAAAIVAVIVSTIVLGREVVTYISLANDEIFNKSTTPKQKDLTVEEDKFGGFTSSVSPTLEIRQQQTTTQPTQSTNRQQPSPTSQIPIPIPTTTANVCAIGGRITEPSCSCPDTRGLNCNGENHTDGIGYFFIAEPDARFSPREPIYVGVKGRYFNYIRQSEYDQ